MLARRFGTTARPTRVILSNSLPSAQFQRRPYGVACDSSSHVTSESLEAKLRSQIEVTQIMVDDVKGNGSFFHIAVQSPAFNGLNQLKQHQLVNKLLKEEIAQIHGLQLKTLATE